MHSQECSAELDTAPRRVALSVMISKLGSIPGWRYSIRFKHHTIFDRSTIADCLRLALRANGLRRVLRNVLYICAPCGWEQGAKCDHIWGGSGLGGIRRLPSRALFGFLALIGELSEICFSELGP